jgi:hypothetical protein
MLVAASLFLAGCASAPRPLSPSELDAYPDARGMPTDVQRFIVRWTDCQHYLGEPDYDEERRRQIQYAISQVCPGIDAEGRRVRARHAGEAAVIERLRDYEPLGPSLAEERDSNARDEEQPGTPVGPEGVEWPADVETFIGQWESCQHALSEPFSDRQRRRMLEQAVREYCPGVDAHGRRIRARYAYDPAMLERLRPFEPLGH